VVLEQLTSLTGLCLLLKMKLERNLLSNQKLAEAGNAELESEFVLPGREKGESSRGVDDKTKTTSDDSEESDSDDDDVVGPLPPAPKKNDEDDSGDDHEVTPVDKIPRSHEIKLGSRAITSLALDPTGARVISGAVDYEL
jgi:hypothetical protein